MEINININQKAMFVISLALFTILATLNASGYLTNNPPILGHTWGEMETGTWNPTDTNADGKTDNVNHADTATTATTATTANNALQLQGETYTEVIDTARAGKCYEAWPRGDAAFTKTGGEWWSRNDVDLATRCTNQWCSMIAIKNDGTYDYIDEATTFMLWNIPNGNVNDLQWIVVDNEEGTTTTNTRVGTTADGDKENIMIQPSSGNWKLKDSHSGNEFHLKEDNGFTNLKKILTCN